jgi:glycerate 2-kinase
VQLQECEITVACDVDNPLLGPRGAVMVYAPQKGASPEQLQQLERNLTHVIDVIEKRLNRAIRDIPGAGAAGGLGAGLLAFSNATLKPGIQMVLDAYKFAEKIQSADLIVTGEGQVDEQTAFGKTISGILNWTKPHRLPVVVVTGNIKGDITNLLELGATAFFPICSGPMTLEASMQQTLTLAENTMANIMRLFQKRYPIHLHNMLSNEDL